MWFYLKSSHVLEAQTQMSSKTNENYDMPFAPTVVTILTTINVISPVLNGPISFLEDCKFNDY